MKDERRFRETIAAGDTMARRGFHIITIGIEPTSPETGYGYIEEGESLTSIDGHTVYRVASFREKPDRATAEAFIRSLTFYWNSGTFLWRASTILDAIGKYIPALYDGLERIALAIGTALVAMIGVDNLVVVETGDALLICHRNTCQDVKEIVRILETEQLTELL